MILAFNSRCLNKIFDSINSISRWCSSLLNHLWNEFSAFLVNVLDWHELLVEQDVLSYSWCLDTHDSSDVFQDDETIWEVFPKEPSVQIELDLHVLWTHALGILAWHGDHWEWNPAVSHVSVEDSLERGLV